MSNVSKGDRPWNDPGPKAKDAAAIAERDKAKPICKAVVLDFAAVANLDTTGVQNLIDTRKEVEKWADQPVEFHFCGILSPWIRRALIAGGFGVGNLNRKGALEVAPVVPQDNSRAPEDEREYTGVRDEESDPNSSSGSSANSLKEDLEKFGPDGERQPRNRNGQNESGRPGSIASQNTLPLLDRSTPFFHFDLADALNTLGLNHALN
jgi:sodium-independent sulfate anion transporter 11